MSPLIISLEGTKLNNKEIEYIQQNKVCGVILFSRNFESIQQIIKLNESIKKLNSDILITVDQEGGRVQRFKEGFFKIPPMAKLGQLYKRDSIFACEYTKSLGVILAYELAQIGVDLSFTPVLDINYNNNSVIGDRSFSNEIKVIKKLANELTSGMKLVGMASVGKHFPGHGYTSSDTHTNFAYDNRSFDELIKDAQIFTQVNTDAIMTAHVIYPQVDKNVCSYSEIWLKKILRQQLNYKGIVFSDDLSMQAADFDNQDSIDICLKSGVDIVIVCNDTNIISKSVSKNYSHSCTLSKKLLLDKDKFNKINISYHKKIINKA